MRDYAVVRVPGSSSNLGAGFDCIGLAVDRWLTVAVAIDADAGARVVIERGGTLTGLDVPPEDDCITAGFRAACRAVGHPVPRALYIRADSSIPVGRGLGSSGAAAVAGAAAANALLDFGLDDRALVGIASALEGHPDNVAPAVYGGAVLAVGAGGAGDAGDERADDPFVTPLAIHSSLQFAIAVPDFAVATKHARSVLPASVPHTTARRAAARAAALVQGLATGNATLIAMGLDDVLHVPFRRPLVRGYDAVTHAALRAGAYGATLSGSGSSIIAVAPAARAATAGAAMVAAWGALGVAATSFTNAARVRGYSGVLDPSLSV